MAGTYPLADTYHAAALAAEMASITTKVSTIVPEAIGLPLPGNPQTLIVTRAEWVERNTAAFGHMLEPARRQMEERLVDQGRRTNPALIRNLMEKEMTGILALLSEASLPPI
jgi:hypothetical protein